MIWLLGGLVTLVTGIAVMNWLAGAKPKSVLKALGWVAVLVLGGAVLILVLTKNIHFIWGILPALFLWLGRMRMLADFIKILRQRTGFARPSPGKRSEISSRFFDLSLDHDSGVMDGRIKEGAFAGALLSELSMKEGQQLFEHVQASGDARSLRLLEAFLDRSHGTAWRQDPGAAGAQADDSTRSHTGTSPRSSDMTEEEALSLLGLPADATEEDIHCAYKRLMKHVHPDRGGSAYLAAKVNEAKDLLLDR